MAIPTRVRERIVSNLRKMLPIIEQQKARDVSEADTVTLVKDLLAEVFGYDKYADLTGEMAIRGTYCDLAIRVDSKVNMLIEVKAIGITLDDRHLKQVVDYAANHGVEWVILTNGSIWRIYEVIFAKPIDRRLLVELDLSKIDLRKEADLELLYLFSKEGFAKGAHLVLKDRQQATSRYVIAALLLNNDAVLHTIRRELRRAVDVLVESDVILNVLRDEVIKRDAQDGPEATAAVKRVNKRESKVLRKPTRESVVDANAADTAARSEDRCEELPAQ